jgi:PAS domain S-box-containing protein
VKWQFIRDIIHVDDVYKLNYPRAMKAQLEEPADAARKAEVLREALVAEDALRQREDYLRLTIDTIPVLAWCTRPDGWNEFLNQRWLDYTGLTIEEARGWGWKVAIHPDDLPRVLDVWQGLLVSGKSGELEARLRRADGVYRWFLFRVEPLRDPQGTIVKWYGINTDIDDRKRAEALLAAENKILEMVATGRPLVVILDGLCRLVDTLCDKSLASILLIDPNGRCLRRGAGPSFLEAFMAAMDGVEIGPCVGSCGTAAYRKEQVIVSDIVTDPLWANYRELALANGLRSGWSTPILSSDGSVLGVFGIYGREPRSPTPQHLHTIKQITHLASVAIERKQAAESLRASELLARGQLDALTHTLDALAQESDSARLLEHVLRTIIEQSDAHSVSVWDRAPDGDWLELFALIEDGRFQTRGGAMHPAARLITLGQDHPVWKEILHTGLHAVLEDIDQPVVLMRVGLGPDATWHDVLDDADLAPALLRFKSHLREMGVHTILFVPMLIAGRVSGFIGIRFSLRRGFRQEEIELTRALAHQATLAIQLTRLSAQSRQSAVMAERNRMARDIHDTLAQGFTGVIVQLEAAEEAMSQSRTARVSDHLNQAGELARESLREARRSVQALRPQALEGKQVSEALKDLIEKMTRGTTVHAEFTLQGNQQKLPPEWEANLLRIGQEVLTNVLRHARASTFNVLLVFDSREIRLNLRDDGCGFDPKRRHEGFGLQGMRERAEGMGGHLSIESANGKGTMISIVLPLASVSEGEKI